MAVHRNARRLVDLAAESDHLQTEELVERYGNQWLATARRSSPTSADAEDAYQRALETLLTNPPETRDPEEVAAWMHTVVRNEALQIVRSRRREVDTEFDVIVGGLEAETARPDESLLDSESHGVAREALRRLRPDQTRCLLLRADGFDYPEICRLTGFSYAKVNRLLSEGRKAARMRVDAIAGGRECERIEPLLSSFVDGQTDAGAEADIRLHLETCLACRATVRDYTVAPRDVASLFPVGLLAAAGWRGRILEPFQRLWEAAQVRLGGGNADTSIAVWKKSLAVFAAGATVVGGGAAIQQHDGKDDRPARAEAQSADRPASPLLTPIDLPEPRAKAKPRNAKRAQAASAEDSANTAVNDPVAVDANPPADVPADQDPAVAADPKDTGANGAGTDDQGGVLAP